MKPLVAEFMVCRFSNLCIFLILAFQCLESLAHVPLPDQSGLAAGRITDVVHTSPGMDVTPWYDANGNVTQMVQVVQTQAGSISFTNRYEYDFDNRLVAVVSPVLVAQYVYDGLGNLLQITEAGSVRRFARDRADGLTRPLAEMSGSNTLVRSYLWANGSLIAQVEAVGAVRYAHFNELGHLLALTDGSGNVTDEFSYHPYGRLVARTGTTETRFGYMAASGVMRSGYDLYLTRHRAYSGNLMRFLGRDPSGLSGGLNLYLYASGNPVLLIDPSGLCAETFHPGYISSPSIRREQELAASFGSALGFGGTMTPEMARSVATDLLLAVPSGVIGGVVDDAIRGAVSAIRGGGSVVAGNQSSALVKYEPWPRVPSSPHADGFLFGARQIEVAQPGQIISRVGETSGRYVSPPGTSLSARGLPSGYQGSESLWQVTKPFKMESGLSAPWQGSSGMGIQHRLPQSIDSLLQSGHVTPVR